MRGMACVSAASFGQFVVLVQLFSWGSWQRDCKKRGSDAVKDSLWLLDCAVMALAWLRFHPEVAVVGLWRNFAVPWLLSQSSSGRGLV